MKIRLETWIERSHLEKVPHTLAPGRSDKKYVASDLVTCRVDLLTIETKLGWQTDKPGCRPTLNNFADPRRRQRHLGPSLLRTQCLYVSMYYEEIGPPVSVLEAQVPSGFPQRRARDIDSNQRLFSTDL